MSENLFGLKPCRFCGAEEEYIQIVEIDALLLSGYKVRCQYCGADGSCATTKATAVEYWNAPSKIETALRAYITKLESQKRWIPVDEQLPEAGQDVAVLDKIDHCVDCWHYSPLVMDYFSRHYSHWMPWEKWMENV